MLDECPESGTSPEEMDKYLEDIRGEYSNFGKIVFEIVKSFPIKEIVGHIVLEIVSGINYTISEKERYWGKEEIIALIRALRGGG